MAFYVESQDRAYRSYIVAEDMVAGELGAHDGSNGAVAFDEQSHAEEDFLGVAEAHRAGDQTAEDLDDTGAILFDASEDDRASFGGDADRDVIKVRTIEDNGTDPAPDISDGDVVGVVDSSAVSDTGAEFTGRVVQEGYADAAPTTFNRSSNNFFAIGVAYRDDADGFDEVVRVEVRKDLN